MNFYFKISNLITFVLTNCKWLFEVFSLLLNGKLLLTPALANIPGIKSEVNYESTWANLNRTT